VHATPLFTTYKQWQRRELLAHRHVQGTEASVPRIQSPIDRFYSKMIPALKAIGITNYLSRREWPVDIVKRIFNELVSETPKDLLAKELW